MKSKNLTFENFIEERETLNILPRRFGTLHSSLGSKEKSINVNKKMSGRSTNPTYSTAFKNNRITTLSTHITERH